MTERAPFRSDSSSRRRTLRNSTQLAYLVYAVSLSSQDSICTKRRLSFAAAFVCLRRPDRVEWPRGRSFYYGRHDMKTSEGFFLVAGSRRAKPVQKGMRTLALLAVILLICLKSISSISLP